MFNLSSANQYNTPSTSKTHTKIIECYIEISGRQTWEYIEQDINGWTTLSYTITSEALVDKMRKDIPDIKYREVWEGE